MLWLKGATGGFGGTTMRDARPVTEGSGLKFQFADALRGPAALCVVVGHIVGNVFPNWPTSRLLLGQLGVAVFFLVSGFVISISLTRYSVRGFLAARALRIYPTYIVALTVTIVCQWIQGEQELSTDVARYVSNYLIANALFGQSAIDGVIWTLQIELHFYLLCALLAPLIRELRLVVLAMPVVLFFAGYIGLTSSFPVVRQLAGEAPFLSFMFAGVAAFYFVNRKISAASLLAYVVLCLLLSAPSISGSPSYVAAVLIFLAALQWGGWLRGGFLSKISYSLYIVHLGVGILAEKLMLWNGHGEPLAVMTGLAAAAAAATIIYFAVEAPTHRLGQLLGRRLSSQLSVARPPDHAVGSSSSHARAEGNVI